MSCFSKQEATKAEFFWIDICETGFFGKLGVETHFGKEGVGNGRRNGLGQAQAAQAQQVAQTYKQRKSKMRVPKKIVAAKPHVEGAGVHLSLIHI